MDAYVYDTIHAHTPKGHPRRWPTKAQYSTRMARCVHNGQASEVKDRNCHCTEASRRAAIKDATEEATEAATNFLEVALCLRQAAYLEVKERRDKLLDAENRARQLLSRSTRVTYEVTERQYRIPPTMLDQIIEYAQKDNGIILPSYDAVLQLAIPQDYDELRQALDSFMILELRNKGTKVNYIVIEFDNNMDGINKQIQDLEDKISRVEDISRLLTDAEAKWRMLNPEHERKFDLFAELGVSLEHQLACHM